MRIFSPLLVLTASFVLVTGCIAGTEENPEDLGVAEQMAGTGNSGPGGFNHISPQCTWSHFTLAAYRQYAQYPLSSAPSISTITPACRRQVLENMIQCSLTSEQTWVDPYDPSQVYTGWWGLAPQWMNNPLDSDGRRWVTGCMAQRLNYYGKSVPILLEGLATPINVDTQLDPLYPFDESTAWGDFFAPPPPLGKTEIYVCAHQDLINLCNGTFTIHWSTYLNYRVCDNVQGWQEADGSYSPCGLRVMGPCNDTSVCFNNTLFSPYKTCYKPDGTTENHTVHVQLEPKTTCSL